MRLKDLTVGLSDPQIYGSDQLPIRGIAIDSRKVNPGDLFIARKGLVYDGRKYIGDAVEKGAVAICSEEYDPKYSQVTQLVHQNLQEMQQKVIGNYYRHPGKELFLVGVTGTNGKTTTTYIIKSILETLSQESCGLMGTICHWIGSKKIIADRTTPDILTVYKRLREMRDNRCFAAVMEVASHGLDQGRTAGVPFDVAVFTNLSPEHLDYHLTMERYCQAKSRLFSELGTHGKSSVRAVINKDDPWSEQIICGYDGPVLWYGTHPEADVVIGEIVTEPSGTRLTLTYQNRSLRFEVPFFGRFNMYNCAAAVCVALCRGYSFEEICGASRYIIPAPGRLEKVPSRIGFHVYIDYAHTEDALRNVLVTLRDIYPRSRIFLIFGCGGDRDKEKREKMGRVAAEHADFTCVTNDNPRSENPEEIIKEIVKGFSSTVHYRVEKNRAIAIQSMISQMCVDDVLLIAGKGHEKEQIFADHTEPFDDFAVAVDALEHR